MTPLLFSTLIFLVLLALQVGAALVVSREIDKLREAEWHVRHSWEPDDDG